MDILRVDVSHLVVGYIFEKDLDFWLEERRNIVRTSTYDETVSEIVMTDCGCICVCFSLYKGIV